MIRFYERKLLEKNHKDFEILSQYICLTPKIWVDGKKIFKQRLINDAAVIQMLPVENDAHEILCYAYQDGEANRELRMLRELEANEDAIQFKDIFPEVKNVVLYGCNELYIT